MISRCWQIVKKHTIWIIMAAILGLGISIGVKASKIYYSSKMDEATLVGGMFYKGKIYTITVK